MFRRESRDPLERQLSQLRQQLEQSALEEVTPDEELQTTPVSDPALTTPRTTIRPAPESITRPAVPGPVDRNLSVLAANARWEGTIQTEGSLVIHGLVQGNVRAAQDVTIAEGAQVDADITAQNVIVHGSVRGRIEARGRLEIHPSSEVVGEVIAPSLVVHEGARLTGQLKMGSGETDEWRVKPGGRP